MPTRTIATGRSTISQAAMVSATVVNSGLMVAVVVNQVVASAGSITLSSDGTTATGTYVSGIGSTTVYYAVTGGNPSGDPILAGATVTITAPYGTWNSDSVAVSAGAVTNSSRTVNAGVFVAASSQSLSVASNSTIQPANDFWAAGWGYSDLGSAQTLAAKYNDAGSDRQWLAAIGVAGGLLTRVSSDGAGNTALNSTATVSANTWFFWMIYVDSVAQVSGQYINTNNKTTAFSAGIFTTGSAAFRIGAQNPSNYLNGRVSSVVFGKSPPGGFATTPAATIATALYNSGVPLRPSQISSAQRTAWGVVSGWLDTTLTADVIGSNTLTNNNTVTLTTVTF